MTIWNLIEKCSGTEIPAIVKFVLEECGYDTHLSLQNISMDDLIDVEKVINNELKWPLCAAGIEMCIQYKRQALFKFLPGHRKLIQYFACFLDAAKNYEVCFEGYGARNYQFSNFF